MGNIKLTVMIEEITVTGYYHKQVYIMYMTLHLTYNERMCKVIYSTYINKHILGEVWLYIANGAIGENIL